MSADSVKLQDRGSPGRPVKTLSEADWNTVWHCAVIGLTQRQAAAAIGVHYETLLGTAGFSDLWEAKRVSGQIAIASAIHEVGTHAKGTNKATMPQVTASIYLSKVRNQWWDRQIVTGADGGPIRFAFADVGDPGRIVEGSATEVPELPPGEAGQAPT